jgi:hypothetical protein
MMDISRGISPQRCGVSPGGACVLAQCRTVFIEGEALGVRKLACAFVISDLYSEEL